MTTASMNAVSHGLFARETVLPSHGEDPAEYAEFLDELTRDLRPQNVLERHCVRTIADALWRLRRFHRWEAAYTPDPTLSRDEQLQKMERAQRTENTLYRRINTALKQLGRDLPELLQTRAHLPVVSDDDPVDAAQNCQNEPRDATILNPPTLAIAFAAGERGPQRSGEVGSSPAADTQNCQNEPEPPGVTVPNPPIMGGPCERSEQGGGLPKNSRRAQLNLLRAERAGRKQKARMSHAPSQEGRIAMRPQQV